MFLTEVYFFTTEISGEKAEVKEKISKMAREKLIEITCEKLKTEPENLNIARSVNGKPFFENYPDFHFNISHSKNAFAIAISDRPVGIDIELLKTPNLAVAKRFFTCKELDYVNQSPNPRFFEIWTKREAYIKRHGLAIKDISVVETKDIFTTEKCGVIISVCCDGEDIVFADN